MEPEGWAEQSNRRDERNAFVTDNARTHRIHRHAKEIVPPVAESVCFLWFALFWLLNYAAGKLSLVQQNSVPSHHMRCMITASRRPRRQPPSACPRRLAMFIAQAFSHDHFVLRLAPLHKAGRASYSRHNRICVRSVCFHRLLEYRRQTKHRTRRL